jgi:hypothetical protein
LQPNLFDELNRTIVKFISDYGIIGIMLVAFFIILTILWVLLPFAVYPLHGSIRRCSRELRLLNRKFDQLISKTSVPVETKEP